MKLFKSKKTRLIALLSTNIAVLSTALIVSTISWYSSRSSVIPTTEIPSSILTAYFDKNDLPEGFDETENPHGSVLNPYVITRPVHYYNLVRLHELGTYGFTSETYFQFGKVFEDGPQDTPLFYEYSDNGVIGNGYTSYLNMEYYSDSLALPPLGSGRHPFECHIIGNDLTVSNLHIAGAGCSDIGIFGYTGATAYINNLYFDSPSIDAGAASAIAAGSNNHASHNTHVYMGYLAGHVYTSSSFNNVYLNNCILYNSSGNEYEMISSYGFFGHTDEPTQSTSDSSSYTSQMIASNAYNALEYTYSMGSSSPLARRYTSETASGNFSGAVSSSNSNYTIGKNGSNDDKPYSLSSIGYSSGDAGSFEYIRYQKIVNNELTYQRIDDVEATHILTDKPEYIEYPENSEPISHAGDAEYDFYGMDDGSYIFYEDGQWKYADVKGDTTRSQTSTVETYCFTISYQQTVNDVTKTYYLKCQEGGVGEYDTLVNVEWNDTNPPSPTTNKEYYFSFRTTFGSLGVSRFTECGESKDYYIYSPVCKKYVCTYAPQNVNNNSTPVTPIEPGANLLHTPIFIPEAGIDVSSGHVDPTKFKINGPNSLITYNAQQNKETGASVDVNNGFDVSAGRTGSTTYVQGALQGSNITDTFGLFGGHKMTANVPGGTFTIGEYIENQTTSLANAVNYKLTSDSSEIVDNSTLVIAGYNGEQGDDYSLDYAMADQSQNNRGTLKVKEVRDSSGYVLNDTTGVAKLVLRYVSGEDDVFTLCDGDQYLCFPGGKDGNSLLFTGGVGNPPESDPNYTDDYWGKNWLKSYDNAYITANSARIPYSQWKFAPYQRPSQGYQSFYTAYRFQNVGDPDRYLCFNFNYNVNTEVNTTLFSCYSLKYYNFKYHGDPDYTPESGRSDDIFDNNNSYTSPEDHTSNARCWFYIYKQQHGQTIQNVHYTAAKVIEVEDAITYPYKVVNYYNLLGSAVENSPTDYSKYTNFTVDPSKNVYFDPTSSQVQYFDQVVEVWKRVNLVSELQDGDTIMFGYNTGSTGSGSNSGKYYNYFMGSQGSNYRNRSTGIYFNPPYCKATDVPSNAQRFTITRTENNLWRFESGTGFLYAASSSRNYLRTEAAPDSSGNADFSISILTNGNANVVAQGNNTRNKIQYYSSWGSGYFSCFSGNQGAIQIYKLAQSSADKATFVGDLIDNFEPFRMDAVGPNITYYSDYMQVTDDPRIFSSPEVGDLFYPSTHFNNVITLLIDKNPSSDLGTLTFEYNSTNDQPWFITTDNEHPSWYLEEAGAVDTSRTNQVHSYLLNINSQNISSLAYCTIKGEGTNFEPYEVCQNDDTNATKYLVVLAAPTSAHITNVTFTFNAVPGNIACNGKVDYRSASYDANGKFNGTVVGGQQVDYTALCIYYDVTNTGQQVGVNVTFVNNTYTITVDTTKTHLTQNLVINIFKYDNNLTSLNVVVDGVSTTYNTGTVTILVEP